MAPYIFGKRSLIHIIDVRETLKGLIRAKSLVAQVVAGGKDVLLVEGPIDIDPFGRLLRYVYLETEEGPIFINAALIETGHAIGLHQGS